MKAKQQMKDIDKSYLKIWLSAIGLHVLHQIEESISFFQWYIDSANHIPKWLLIQSVENAKTILVHPGYFVLASAAQIIFISFVAFLFRNNERVTRIILPIYLSGLTFFLVWHIVISYVAHSYAPILITCIGGIYFIPNWFYKFRRVSKKPAQKIV